MKLLPDGVDRAALPLLLARGLRALADGWMAVLLPAYLIGLGFGTVEVGAIATATMLGSAAATLAVGAWGHRWAGAALLRGAALLMLATGIGFASIDAFVPLLAVAFVGTLNPSSGDVSVFLPLEHARLAGAAGGAARTALFARYSVTGAVCAALGALAAGLPDLLAVHGGIGRPAALRLMCLLYAAVGAAVWLLYRRIDAPGRARLRPAARSGADAGLAAPPNAEVRPAAPPAPLGPSRRIVLRLAALFSVDAFAGGLVVNSLLALWLLQRHGLSLAQAGGFFFWAGLLSAASQLLAPRVAQRIGLVNTMVLTHIPANLCLIGAAFAPDLGWALALLFVRSALSQMDVPTRSAFVMAVVTPPERPAAASLTAVPRSLASALSPTLSGALFAAGWIGAPLVACGVLKIAYDVTLWLACRRVELRDQ